MKTLTIDTEFQNLIPPISEEEDAQLTENLMREGCRDALVVWGDILIDGHNRYRICTENNIEFKTEEKEFADRDEAKKWIINNQFGRRNLNPYQRAALALQLEDMFKAEGRRRILAGKKLNADPTQNSAKGSAEQITVGVRIEEDGTVKVMDQQQYLRPLDTRTELAKKADVSHNTIDKVRYIINNAPETQKRRLELGEASVHEVYTKTMAEVGNQDQQEKMRERNEKIRLEKARKENKEAQEKLKENERAGFAKSVFRAIRVDMNRVSYTDPQLLIELKSLRNFIDEMVTRIENENN